MVSSPDQTPTLSGNEISGNEAEATDYLLRAGRTVYDCASGSMTTYRVILLLLLQLCSVGLGNVATRAYSQRSRQPDPSIDCPLRNLAWEYAQKLFPQRGSFPEVYDGLQLAPLCNISLARQKSVPSKLHVYKVDTTTFNVFVDSRSGNDDNPGTLDKPLKTLGKAVDVYEYMGAGKGGFIYLREGTYFLSSKIDLGPEHSFLTISGYKDEKAVVSGGQQYKFKWLGYRDEMGPLLKDTNCMADSEVKPGESNTFLKYYGNVSTAVECQNACYKNVTCFAFIYHDGSTKEFTNMCYFRSDGLCPYAYQIGCTSGKYINIMVTDLSNQKPNNFTSLFIDGRRAVRARYPDGNPETMGLHTQPTGYVSKAESWLPPVVYEPALEIHIASPERNHTHFPQFQIGIGGPVSNFNPPESYWGTAHPSGGGGRTYVVPSGLQYSSTEVFANRTWKTPETGVVHAFHCSHWGNWMFALKERDYEQRYLKWTYGGFQEARGCKTGQEWYVENIFEELDSPNEWYLDYTEMKLYYYPNGSLPSSGIATSLDQLMTIRGTQLNPVYNITLTNLTFAHTATTFLSTYEVPSGGDWAVHRGGAVFVEGIDGFFLHNCLFDAPGGNAVFLSKYVRNAVVENNEFVLTGDSAIVAIGSSKLIDGTTGDQPRGTKILSNVAREIGVFGKQVSPYMQSLACQTEIIGNVFFNGARAGININDGFGGGNLIKNNLLFNLVRETRDHGPINTWDRQPYLTKVRNGSASLVPATSNTTQNFIICDYNSWFPIDHDDGSCYYYDSLNFNIYGGFKDLMGHSVMAKNNIYVYPDAAKNIGLETLKPFCAIVNAASRTVLPSGWNESWINNTCVIGKPDIYQFSSCDPEDPKDLVPFTANNSFYAPRKEIYIRCGGANWTLSDYQKMGYDIGSTVSNLPPIEDIVEWGKQLLEMR